MFSDVFLISSLRGEPLQATICSLVILSSLACLYVSYHVRRIQEFLRRCLILTLTLQIVMQERFVQQNYTIAAKVAPAKIFATKYALLQRMNA